MTTTMKSYKGYRIVERAELYMPLWFARHAYKPTLRADTLDELLAKIDEVAQ